MVQYLVRLLSDFKRDERGAFSVFLVGMFTTLILVSGAAIDLVRFEAVRSSIQFNLDRAVLAAASIRQVEEPGEVVEDYMSKVSTLTTFNVNMDTDNTNVTVSGRKVAATATATLNTYFLRIIGIDDLDVTAYSTASEIIPNIEISMVLDISGSMKNSAADGGTKIAALQTAGVSFIDTMVTDAPDGSVTSVSIVPYASNVALPQNMWDEYATEGLHTLRRCAVFDRSTYTDAAISVVDTLPQLSYFDTGDSYDNFGSGIHGNYDWCSPTSEAEIMPFSTDDVALKLKINNLVAIGGTATHIGTKWGLALLDPAARTVATATGSADAAGRPYAYSEPDVLKVLVVMTDGVNSNHKGILDPFRTGDSDMWSVLEEGDTPQSVCPGHPGWVWYFDNQLGTYPWLASYCSTPPAPLVTKDYINKPNTNLWFSVETGNSSNSLPGNNAAPEGTNGYRYHYSWPEVWGKIEIEDFADIIGESVSDYYGTGTTTAQADDDFDGACSAAKNKGVVVYTIAFEAPANAISNLRDCATTAGHAYDVDGTDIDDAFSAIAASIQKLKLTQ